MLKKCQTLKNKTGTEDYQDGFSVFAYSRLAVGEVLKRFATGENGLTDKEARSRIARFG